jgi:NADH-quinone oxidoreductase subunit C
MVDVQTLAQVTEEKLRARFGEQVLAVETHYDYPVVYVSPQAIHPVLQFLKEETQLEYHFLTHLCGAHYPDRAGQELEVVYHLHNMPENRRLRIKTMIPIDNPSVPTSVDLWPAANWLERETWDFYGIVFEGHPNLVRILNMDEMNYHPMRKEFPLEDGSRDDKNNAMFGR